MPQQPEDKPSLPVRWAFVVQFREGTDVKHGRFEGRVEHIVSGQTGQFHSLDELLAFLTRILTQVRAPPEESYSGFSLSVQ